MRTLRLLASTLLGLTLSISGVSFADHVDPSPISDEVIGAIARIMNPGDSDPLPQIIRQQMDELAGLLSNVAGATDKSGSPWSTQRMLLEGKLAELKNLREEAAARLAPRLAETLKTPPIHAQETAGAKGIKGKNEARTLPETQNPDTLIRNRFGLILDAVEQVLKATSQAERAKASQQAMAVLDSVGGLAKRRETLNHIDSQPTFRQDTPTKARPDDLKSAAEPIYMAHKRRSPANNVYAFLGNTLLAAIPDPTPAEATTCGYNAADLTENEEIKLTPEIKELAGKLGYSPVKILQYVTNEIAFEPYYGSLKGAEGALVSKAGGPTDQASLLIALLRASNIPARYVLGTARFEGGDPRFLRWVGAKTYQAGANILGQGKIPSTYGTDWVEFTHVWVEACVPYGNYRGSAADRTGFRWIPLDASLKEKTYQAGIAINVDFDYDSYMLKRTDGSDSLPHEKYLRQVETQVKSLAPNYSNNTLADIPYLGKPAPRKFDVLPASLPYIVKTFSSWGSGYTAETDTVPDAHRIKIEITGTGYASPVTISMPGNVLKRITLAYKPATTGDVTNYQGYVAGTFDPIASGCVWYYNQSGSCNLKPLNVVPEIKLDGGSPQTGASTSIWTKATINWTCGASSGTCMWTEAAPYRSFAMSTRVKLNGVALNSAVFDGKIKPSDYYAIQAYAFQGSDRLLKERGQRLLQSVRANADPNTNLDETLGEFLHIAGLKYMRYITDASKRLGDIDGSSGWSGNHIGVTSVNAKAEAVLDLPFGVSNPKRNFVVDVPGGLSRGVDLSTGSTVWKTFLLGGYAGSAYESYLWQENAKLDAVSTVRGVQYAKEKGIEILALTPAMCVPDQTALNTQLAKLTSNTDSTLNYSANQVSSYRTLICTDGYTIKLPRSLIRYLNWTGAVYFTEKQAANGSMSAGFSIGGGLSGGYSLGTYLSPSWLTNTTSLGINSGWSLFNPLYNAIPPTSTSFVTPPTLSSWVGLGSGGGNVLGKDPVNMVTGNMYHTERDIALKGRGLPIVLERAYNSRGANDGPFGFGWTHSFNHGLTFNDPATDGSTGSDGKTSSITWTDGTGAQKFIAVTGNPGVAINAAFTAPKGYYFTTARNADGTYGIREKNGLTYTFENLAGTPGQKARLIGIKDRNGNTLTLTYTGANLATVKDGLSRTLTFTYNANNRITQIQDWAGRQFRYEYDANGNLTAFKNPLAAAGSQNPVSYTYYTTADSPTLNHAMKSYLLPRGNGMTFEYYANGKVFKHYDTLGETSAFTYNDFRRETAYIDERGLERRFFFDENGNPLQVQDEQGAYREYTYDPADPAKKLSKRDPMGLITQYAYDATGNVTRITNPDGNSQEFHDFTAYNQPQRIKDPRGNWTLLKYDARGNLTDEIRLKSGIVPSAGITPAAGNIVAWTSRTYDPYGNPTSSKRIRDFTTAAGPLATTTYDAGGLNPVQITRSGDKTGDGVNDSPDSATLAYDTLGRQTQGIDADWQPTQTQYDTVDRAIRATDALGNWRDYKYDANGNLIEDKLVNNGQVLDRATHDYDFSDRPERSWDSAGSMSAAQYDAAGNAIRLTDADGYTAQIQYDAMNRPVAAQDQEGNSVATAYDLNGQARIAVDPNGNSRQRTYYGPDKNGRLKRTLDPLGRATQYDYDANGNLTSVTDNLGRTSKTFYDELNRPTRAIGPIVTTSGGVYPVTCNKYDALGRPVELWAGTTTDATATTCDLTGADPGLTKQLGTQYDDYGRKLKETDPLGKVTSYLYDLNNNLTEATDPKGQKTQLTWAPGHQLLTRAVKNTDGTIYQTVSTTRNALGQPTRIETRDAAGSLIAATDTSYDSAHRPISVTDSRGNKTLTYAYSPGGQLNTLQDNEGHRTDYLYDPVGRLIGIWAPNDDYIAYAHDAGGRPTEKWYPNGVNSQLAWNPDDSLAKLKNRVAYDDAHVISRHDYAYTALGQRQSSLEKVGSLAQPAQDESYGYDLLDNRVSKTVAGTTTHTLTNAANQVTEQRSGSPTGPLTAAYVYDDNGNLTKKCEGGTVTHTATDCTGASVTNLTWNPLDQLVQVQKTGLPSESYTYDHAGRRSSNTVNGTTTNYLYNGEDLHAEYTSWTTAQAVYTHGPETDDPLIRSTATQTIYYHRDGLGSVVATSDQGGNIVGARTYDAWGNTLAQTGNIPQYGYTGREPDATGLVYYRARYYDPSIGRFISKDPSGMPDGVNRYAYAANDPVNGTDPSGELLNFVGGAIANVAFGGTIRMATGGSFWDAKAMLTDAAIGAATSGLAALNAVRRGAQIAEGVYVAKTASNVKYVGQSGNIEGRLAQHVASGKITTEAAKVAQKFEVLGGKTAREVAEQRTINGLGGIGKLENKVNPVGGRMNLLDDASLGTASKNNLINWPGVIAADFGIDSGFASLSASGNANLSTFTNGVSLAPYGGSSLSGVNATSMK